MGATLNYQAFACLVDVAIDDLILDFDTARMDPKITSNSTADLWQKTKLSNLVR
jgi:hypothetical protein